MQKTRIIFYFQFFLKIPKIKKLKNRFKKIENKKSNIKRTKETKGANLWK